jgi:hypothetical protein
VRTAAGENNGLASDEGMELREEIKARLHQSLAAVQTNGETRSAQEVAAKLGLEW